MDGVLLINKESGWTSRDVCNKIQKILGTKSVGHTGTLDPFAEGLLVVTVNKANKIAQFVEDNEKTYIATLKLGVETTTGDLTGEIISNAPVQSLNKTKIEEVLKSFLGKQKQIPPMTSAVHYNGRKLYEWEHDGIKVDRLERDIEIFDIRLLDFHDNIIVFESTVSKGTYIRVLGEDIAKRLNTVGHLTELVRTKINDLTLDGALKIGEVTLDSPFIKSTALLSHFEKHVFKDEMAKKVMDGMSLYINEAKDDRILIVDALDNPLAIYERRNDRGLYKCLRGLW